MAKKVETLTHDGARRRNAPTAEAHALMTDADKVPVRLAYQRRDRDLDPQLVWRGKDEQDESDLIVQAPPLYIQEKVHPKALVDDLVRASERPGEDDGAPNLFADFNGVPEGAARTEFYRHDANWANRMVLGDALRVMGSLADRDGLRGKVQCVYIDPPYGIRFNSNFQWSTTSRDVKDGKREHITREPEQVKAFRDTWRDGIHSYLSYLRDRLTAARDLLADSGSVFVQIGDENVHRVRALMDEVFGEENFCSQINFNKTGGFATSLLSNVTDTLIWYSKDRESVKYRALYDEKKPARDAGQYDWAEFPKGDIRRLSDHELSDPNNLPEGTKILAHQGMSSQGISGVSLGKVTLWNQEFSCPANSHWKTHDDGIRRLDMASRLFPLGKSFRYKRMLSDFPVINRSNIWVDVGISGFSDKKIYVVQTNAKVVERCILMTTDPGDLVLDPTCGSGTTAYVAEQWGRRWITIDTSRVALALARARVMGARYPWYLLADSPEGQRKEAELTRRAPAETPTGGDVRQGFVYARVPHVTLKSIANNAEIDTIWEAAQDALEPLRATLNAAAGESWEEWQVPREAGANWPDDAKTAHAAWWEARIARQREIDAAIAAKADTEYLYDKPYEDKARVRVAGPFTVESLVPHRMLAVDEDGESFHTLGDGGDRYGESPDFARTVLDHLRIAGVQQAHREDRITFSSVAPWPGDYVCAEGRYAEGGAEDGTEDGAVRRAGVFIGPEFGTVQRADLVGAAREAAEAGFDVLVACAFAYDAHSTEFEKLGRVPVLKARMNADLHMAGDLKNTGKGNLFVVFGEPDIDIEDAGEGRIRVRVNGVDVFHPNTGEVRSDGPEGIACWFVDTDYDEESFFVRHAYFLGANDPYKALKTTLKAEIDADAWASLHSAVSRPFPRPASGRIAVKVINRLGDEAMKVFRA